MREDRRRVPGAVGFLWCRGCKARFIVAGGQIALGDGPSIELIVCPQCRAMRRMVLPPAIGAPFRLLGPSDRVREG